jgi:hypothetical protein
VKRNGTKRYICETKRTETNQNNNVPKPCNFCFFRCFIFILSTMLPFMKHILFPLFISSIDGCKLYKISIYIQYNIPTLCGYILKLFFFCEALEWIRKAMNRQIFFLLHCLFRHSILKLFISICYIPLKSICYSCKLLKVTVLMLFRSERRKSRSQSESRGGNYQLAFFAVQHISFCPSLVRQRELRNVVAVS